MDQGYSCVMCRHWRRMGPRSGVGRCENPKSSQTFTREQLSCNRFEILMFLGDPPPASAVHVPA